MSVSVCVSVCFGMLGEWGRCMRQNMGEDVSCNIILFECL